jgi:hypothetical protein
MATIARRQRQRQRGWESEAMSLAGRLSLPQELSVRGRLIRKHPAISPQIHFPSILAGTRVSIEDDGQARQGQARTRGG